MSDESDNIDKLVGDLNNLGISEVEVDIRYGMGKRSKFIKVDSDLAADLKIANGETITRIRGEAFAKLVDLSVVTSNGDRIKLRCISEDVTPIANYIEFRYIKKEGGTSIPLLNYVNSVTIDSHFNKYISENYSPVEFFYICINLTVLGSHEEFNMVVRKSKASPESKGNESSNSNGGYEFSKDSLDDVDDVYGDLPF